MSFSPRISIGMPVYNGEAFLASTLEAFQCQTLREFELTICDNASTDATGAISEAFAARDPRIRYVRNETNIGANANFRAAAKCRSAPLFKWAAHDDHYAPTYLERCVGLLDADAGLVMAHSGAVFIDEAGLAFAKGASPGS